MIHYQLSLSRANYHCQQRKKNEVVCASRYFIIKLLSLSAKCGKVVDFQKALTYSLYPI